MGLRERVLSAKEAEDILEAFSDSDKALTMDELLDRIGKIRLLWLDEKQKRIQWENTFRASLAQSAQLQKKLSIAEERLRTLKQVEHCPADAFDDDYDVDLSNRPWM